VLGIAAGGVFGALWNLEKQSVARLQQELQEVQQQVQQAQQQLAQAEQQLQQERKVGLRTVASHTSQGVQ
jgi:flagellar biosynthesis chaperone FliJ